MLLVETKALFQRDRVDVRWKPATEQSIGLESFRGPEVVFASTAKHTLSLPAIETGGKFTHRQV